MSTARRAFLTTTAALALGFSAAAAGWSMNWGSGELVKGDGKTARETRAAGEFDAIGVSGDFEVRVRQSGSTRVEVESDGNLLPYVETRVVDGKKGRTLEISVKRGYRLAASQPIRVQVDLAQLRAVSIAGSGKTAIESFKSERLDLSIAGSGSVSAPRLDAGKVSMSIAGSGDIISGGRAAEVGVSIAGSGDVKAAELAGDEVKVSISGSGNATVNAARTLKVSIAGSGDVRYAGSPQLSTSVAGSGSVSKL